MTDLSLATWRTRRADIIEQLRTATDDHRRACYRRESGAGTADAVAAARAAMAVLEERLLGLDAAWAETEREAREAALAADQYERGAALTRIGRLVADRDQAAAAIEQALQPLKAAIRAFDRANHQIIAEARPHARHFDAGGMADFRWTVFPSPPAEQAIIGGLLYDAGWRLEGLDLHQAWLDLQGSGTEGMTTGALVDAVRQRGARILAEAAVILPDLAPAADDSADPLPTPAA